MPLLSHISPQMTAGSIPITLNLTVIEVRFKERTYSSHGRTSQANLLLTSSVEYHHAGDHEHWVPVEHGAAAIPGKASTPVLHPVDSEEDTHGTQ